jgi:hypothetical protein
VPFAALQTVGAVASIGAFFLSLVVLVVLFTRGRGPH